MKKSKKIALIAGITLAAIPAACAGFLWLGLSKTLNGIKIPADEYENEE